MCSLYSHILYKSEEVIPAALRVVIFATMVMHIVRIRMVFIVELNDLESTLIHIEVDITLFEIRLAGFPEHSFRILCFNSFPSR